MIRKSTVRFGQLRSFLESLGFHAEREKAGWRFEHAPSGTVLLFRPYRANDFVYAMHLFQVRSALDWNGLVAAEAFDDSLTKTPA
jgi:hypothetical protein